MKTYQKILLVIGIILSVFTTLFGLLKLLEVYCKSIVPDLNLEDEEFITELEKEIWLKIKNIRIFLISKNIFPLKNYFSKTSSRHISILYINMWITF